MVYSQIENKTREFNLPMIMLTDMHLMTIMIKLSILRCPRDISEIFDQKSLDGVDGEVNFLIDNQLAIDMREVIISIIKIWEKSPHITNSNMCNIGIITVEKIGKMKPKYIFVVLGVAPIKSEIWLILVNYIGDNPKLGILCNIVEKYVRLYFTASQLSHLLRKYKLNIEYRNPDDNPADNPSKEIPLVERKTSISNPLKAGKISRLKHAVGKQAHKAAKNVKRLFGKTVSLSKSKGSFTRIRVEPEKNAKEVMARIKERFGEGNPGKKGSPKENVTQPSKTNWDKFLKQIKLESQQEKAVRQYETLKRNNISGTNLQ